MLMQPLTWFSQAALGRVTRVSGAGSCASSDGKISSSPKSGAWKGVVVGGGDGAVERRGCPSRGVENSDVESMTGLPFVTGPSWGLACRDRARRRYSLVILAYGLKIRICVEPKSTSAAIPSSMPITRPRPYMSCVTWSPMAKCLGAGVTGALKGLVGK